jgi:hypothetical protein
MRPFLAEGPDPALAEKLALFGQFVGSWDLEIVYHDPERRLSGEWHFAWALDGRAVQDVWIAPGVEWGTTLRFFDPRIDAWRSTWIGPHKGLVLPFVAKQVGDEIVLEREEVGTTTRWIFSEVAPESFHWRAVESRDGGESWTLVQEMDAVKRADPPLV